MKAARMLVPLVVLLVIAIAIAVGSLPGFAQEDIKNGATAVAGNTGKGLGGAGEVITDGSITTRVQQRFGTESLLKDSNISIVTDHHVVTLKGTVTNEAGRRKAAGIARRTKGVRRVVNRLTVSSKRSH
jgi:osmotically-inducible protein OsmY